MANNNGQVEGSQVEGEETEGEGAEETPDYSQERLALIERNQALIGLMQDPDIAKVIAAKRAGKPVNVSEVVQKVEDLEDDVDPAAELEENDPARKVLESMTKVIDAKLERALGPLLQRLDGVQSVAEQVQARDVTDQIKAAKEQFKDFDKYKTQILELSREHAGLKVKDLYILAKSRAGDLRMVETVTQTEKPTNQLRKSTKPASAPPPRPRSRKGFTDLLAESLGGLDLESLS